MCAVLNRQLFWPRGISYPCQIFLFSVVFGVTELIDPIYQMNYVCCVSLYLPCAEHNALMSCNSSLIAVFRLYCSLMYLKLPTDLLYTVAACCSTRLIVQLLNLTSTVAAVLQASVVPRAFEYYLYFSLQFCSHCLWKTDARSNTSWM